MPAKNELRSRVVGTFEEMLEIAREMEARGEEWAIVKVGRGDGTEVRRAGEAWSVYAYMAYVKGTRDRVEVSCPVCGDRYWAWVKNPAKWCSAACRERGKMRVSKGVPAEDWDWPEAVR